MIILIISIITLLFYLPQIHEKLYIIAGVIIANNKQILYQNGK
jgi:hypothetical protein